jgi:PAS domain S-box-containing protein
VRRPALRASRNIVVLTLVALLPVGLLAASSIVLATHQIDRDADRQVQTTAAVSAVVVGQETTELIALMQSYVLRHSLITDVSGGAGADTSIETNLANLAGAFPGISASFVTTKGGTSLATYPPEPAVYGTNFAYRDWYQGLVRTGRPYVSNAIVTKETSHALAITVTDYIRNTQGVPVGILGVNYTLQAIAVYATHVARAQGITLEVTDRVGTSLTAGGAHGLVSVAGDPRVKAALAGRTGLLNYAPRQAGGGHGPAELSAYTPVAGTGWTVIASVPDSAAFAALDRLRETVLAITAVLVLILIVGVRLVAVAERRRRDSEGLVQARDRDLARVLEATDFAFVSVDRSGAITQWNDRAEDIYGWSTSEVVGRQVEMLIPAADRHEYRDRLATRFGRTTASEIGERREMAALHRDGHEITVEVVVWLHDDGLGFSSFIHEISERVAIAAALEEARDQALAASRMKSEFLANMSHEIRTPMNGVIGMSGLLLKTELDETQRDYAETVCSSAEALLTVIDDILDFSKIEAGKLDVESVSFDLRAVVEESAVLLAARAQQKNLELTCHIDAALPPALRGDPGRLRQVLLNLLGNAVKFTATGEVNVSAQLAHDEVDGVVSVELLVRDTGIGMTGESLEHLFDAFTQAESSTSRRFGGTGLGLAISRQLVELMGGILSVTSEVGVGSTFVAVIPFPVSEATVMGSVVTDLDGVRVLIVDDNVTNQRVLQEMVGGWGCLATNAGGVEQALRLLGQVAATDDFDVILLDLNMPDLDGYDLARMVRADPRLADIPMIMLTSSAQRGEAEKTEQAGIVAYLTKPVRSALLHSAMSSALQAVSAGPPGVAASSAAAPPAAAPPVAVAPVAGPPVSGPEATELVASSPPGPFDDESTVLLVEDNVVNQKVFSAMLASIGYRVDVAENGFDALEAMERHHYGAVFMDCQMPVMDGYQTTEKIREREGADRHTKVIAVTASAMASDRDRCLDAGMDDYMTKPLKAVDLAAKLTFWLHPEAETTSPAWRGPAGT